MDAKTLDKTLSPIGTMKKSTRRDMTTRMRRNRSSEGIRTLLRENDLLPRHMILPVFIEENTTERQPIGSIPGLYRETEQSIGTIAKQAETAGLGGLMLFGVSHNKDHSGSDSLQKGGLLDRMVNRAKEATADIPVIADLCFCEYTDHGHCGPLTKTGTVDNDETINNIAQQAIIAAEAGADIVAPSGMMDGQVAAIRKGLDSAGFQMTPIMAYAAKYASHFYGPFRDAAGCSLQKGDRKTYQMDFANGDEALREVAIDIEEGADMVMVKPGLPYLDIIWRVKEAFGMPTFAYNVSGEFSMLKFAAEAGCIDYSNALIEMLMSFRRAGANGILTYGALDAANIIENS